DGMHAGGDGDLLRSRLLRDFLQAKRKEPRIESQPRGAVEASCALTGALDGEPPCDGAGDELIVGRAFVALQRSLEVAHERTLLGTASKIGFVEPAHSARNDISLQKVEARTAVRTGAHRDEVHDLFDFIGADLPVLAD